MVDAVSRILGEYYSKRDRIMNPVTEEADPFDKDPPRNVRSYQQSTSDVQGDSPLTARDIGTLIRGKTRLNVVSALTENDLVDFFKFNVASAGPVQLGVTGDAEVNVQIINRRGDIIADSGAIKGSTKAENFEKLNTGDFDMAAGDYTIKVTRGTSVQRSERPNYAIQISAARYYEQDFDTIESAAAKISVYAPSTLAAAGMNDVLSQIYGGLFDFKV
jgi:hypothetical protein